MAAVETRKPRRACRRRCGLAAAEYVKSYVQSSNKGWLVSLSRPKKDSSDEQWSNHARSKFVDDAATMDSNDDADEDRVR
jgi:hypothetical protein